MRGWKKSALQGGMALLETLVAISVMGFGLIAISKFQGSMVQNTSFAHEQNLAIRIAESKIERLRLFQGLVAATDEDGEPIASYEERIVTGADTLTSGVVTFNRSWTVTPRTPLDSPTAAPGLFKEIVVTVTWTDAQNIGRSIQVSSLIQGYDPKALASMMKNYTEPGNPVQPFNRVLKVPIPAIIDPTDPTKSLYTPPGGTGASIQLDNTTGLVTSINGTATTTTTFLLSGYLGFGTGADNPAVTSASAIDFQLLNAAGTAALPGFTCWDDSHIVNASKTYPAYIIYTCVVESNATITIGSDTIPVWSGQMKLSLGGAAAPNYGWTLTPHGASAGDRVCRYAGTVSPYALIQETLASQNYIAIKDTRGCPSGTLAFQP